MSTAKNLTRRRFLEQSGKVLASALAIPAVVPSGVLAAPNRPGPNERVGVGFIGAGRRCGNLRGRFPKTGQIVGINDVFLPRAQSVAKRYGCPSWQDYRKLLESKDVDAVIVTTPDHWHTLPSIHACQAGKHVYCEKPLTLTIHEGRLLVDAARKYKRVFQTGSQQRSMIANRVGCQLVREGKIGKLKKVLAADFPSPWECAFPGQPTPKGLDWDAWCGQAPLRSYHADLFAPRTKPGWISFRPYSGGEVTGWGAHGLDQVQWALGMDDTGPVEVWTEGDAFAPPTYDKPESRSRGEKICRKPKVFYRYANGVVLELGGGPGGGAVFLGEKGKITINRGSAVSDPKELAAKALEAERQKGGPDGKHLENWIECIHSGAKPTGDVEIGHRSATVCHLANIARWVGRKLRWDPKTETFPGDAEANALITREQRKPYELPKQV